MFLRRNSSYFWMLCFVVGWFVSSCGTERVGIEGVEVSAYPNPFPQHVNINVSAGTGSEIRIYLYDQSQNKLKVTETSEDRLITKNPVVEEKLAEGLKLYRFDFSQMEDGVYFLDVVVNGGAQRTVLFKGEPK